MSENDILNGSNECLVLAKCCFIVWEDDYEDSLHSLHCVSCLSFKERRSDNLHRSEVCWVRVEWVAIVSTGGLWPGPRDQTLLTSGVGARLDIQYWQTGIIWVDNPSCEGRVCRPPAPARGPGLTPATQRQENVAHAQWALGPPPLRAGGRGRGLGGRAECSPSQYRARHRSDNTRSVSAWQS